MQISINPANAIYDQVDGDIIIIHLGNGNYYNLTEVGAMIWIEVCKSTSIESLKESLICKYQVSDSQLHSDIELFIAQLQEQELILIEDNDCESVDEIEQQIDQIALKLADRSDYTKPELNVFTDMQDFLLVDPIHEVDDQGLPLYKSQNVDG